MPDFTVEHAQNTIVTDPEGALAVQTPDSDLVDATTLTSPLENDSPAEARAADPDSYGGAPASAVNDVQTITVSDDAGTWGLTIKNPLTAVSKTIANTALDFDITAADLQAALENLENLNPGDVVVTGGPGDKTGTKPYVLTFQGSWAGTPVTVITTDATKLSGTGAHTAAVVHTTTGAP